MFLRCVGRHLLTNAHNALGIPSRRGGAVYGSAYAVQEEEIRQKLQRFPGGSINLVKQESGIAVMTISNPARMNAFSGTMMLELQDHVSQLEEWTEGKGLIVRGDAGTFCSGSDLNAVRAISDPQEGMKMCMFMQNVLTRLLRLMTVGSEIRFVHKHMGLVPGWGGAARLVRIVGSQNALKLLAGAQKVDPAYAEQIGLSDGVVGPQEGEAAEAGVALGEAEQWLSSFTRGPASVIQAVKKVVLSGRELPLEDALRTERDVFGTVWGGPANLDALARKSKHK
ncbi:ethylmalonyl-CoA decarboxylase isoform X2 [Anguilla rostrata]|uniref:ethylmalonyl-CoA decarboxylase isoform X2 n=1 Tax=Anguilla rostrata TaxID=7938 RepID=UPI0030D5FC8C